MEITLLCIGDVVGRPGRTVVSQAVPKLVRQYSVDCVIANLENAAAGSGLTVQLYHKYLRYGVHLMTMGDHIYRKAELMPILEQSDRIVRPANYPAESVGQDCAIFQCKTGPKIAVVSIMGRRFMHPPCDCPFHAIDRVMAKMPHDVKIVVVDMPARATSEKIAMAGNPKG